MTFSRTDSFGARLVAISLLATIWAASCEARRRELPGRATEHRAASPAANERVSPGTSPRGDSDAGPDRPLETESGGAAPAAAQADEGDAAAASGGFESDAAYGGQAGDSQGGASGETSRPVVEVVRFVALGDYGWSGPSEQQVAELVRDLEPDFVLTTGDNNYPAGAADTIDTNIGQYYSDFIFPYRGTYGSSATTNRFFPALGNHDWYTDDAAAYLAYFELPGNERYYDVVLGNVHFFALDSDEHEPDGVSATSVQALWLQRGLAASTSAFNVVAMHHPPYSSGPHGDTAYMQWPYAEWGADLVLAGHDHCYERLYIDDVTYIVSGLGGASLYSFGESVAGSVTRYNAQFGATLLEVSAHELRSTFFDVDGNAIDSTRIRERRRR